jgi:hypothetical protein
MIELIFVACLKLASGSCEERSHLHMAEIGIMGCMLTAQALVADWSGAHPEFEVVRWSCRWAGSGATGA